MHRARYLIAIVAVLTLAIQFVVPTAVGAQSAGQAAQTTQTGNNTAGQGDNNGQGPTQNPQQTGCNANNPNGGGCPVNSISNGPVCGNGQHIGNPHCTPPEGTGTITICKAFTGTTSFSVQTSFDFTVDVGGTPTTVTLTAMSAADGPVCNTFTASTSHNTTITEQATTGFRVTDISVDSGCGSTVGTTTTSATVLAVTGCNTTVTFTNQGPTGDVGGAGSGSIEVCKIGATADVQGQSFSFGLSPASGSTSSFSLIAGTANSPGCTAPLPFDTGTAVTVTENATTGFRVQAGGISFTGDGTNTWSSTSNGTATVTVQSGLTVITFVNEVAPVATGILKICKASTGTPAIAAGTAFNFTFSPSGTAFNGTATVGTNASPLSVIVGQCSLATVAAGTVNVTEPATTGFQLVSVNLGSANGTAVSAVNGAYPVTVSANQETVVYFTNQVQPVPTGSIEICKVGATADVQGQSFSFNLSQASNDNVSSATLVAGTANSPGCTSPIVYNTGASVTVTEAAATGFQVQAGGISFTGTGTNTSSNTTNRTASLTVQNGLTVITFVNETLPLPAVTGTLKICKATTGTPAIADGTAFNFTFSPSGTAFGGTATVGTAGNPLSVLVGQCSLATVAAGTVNVTEPATTGFQLVSVNLGSANGTAVSAVNGAYPVTVSANQETVVYFTNEVYPQILPVTTGSIEICKIGATADVQGQRFNFSLSPAANDNTSSFSLTAGSANSPGCTSPIAYNTNTAVTVTENAAAGFRIQAGGISFSGPGTNTSSSTTNGTATVTVQSGLTVITFVNEVIPPTTGTIEVCKVGATAAVQGQTFSFGLSPASGNTSMVNLVAGTANSPGCTSPLTYNIGTAVTVTEAAASGFRVQAGGITFSGPGTNTSSSVANRTATATVQNGLTVITFTNEVVPVVTGQIEVCKIGATADVQGQRFSFGLNPAANDSTSSFSLTAGSANSPGCTAPITYNAGTAVTVTEAAVNGFRIQAGGISFSGPGTNTSSSTTNGTATMTVQNGLTVITFTNEVVPVIPPPTCTNLTVTQSTPGGVSTVNVTVTSSTGLASITETANTTNFGALTITPAITGSAQSVLASATETNVNLTGRLEILVTDVAGNTILCDPISATVHRTVGRHSNKLLSNSLNTYLVSQADRYVFITNGSPHGLSGMKIKVNGHTFTVTHLKAGQTRHVDIHSALRAGTNTVLVVARGKRTATAHILISDTLPLRRGAKSA